SSSQLPTLTCKWCVTNIDAFVKINELSGTPNFSNAMILDELGIAIWTGAELIGEFQGYQSTSAQLPR
ncbi:hypothetical protein SHY80_10845, partial [Streptococcus suis]|uniref:hypothetical protein n=1 Tax=Streptococcus suis TaxID=1307 RepID=UPI0029C42408